MKIIDRVLIAGGPEPKSRALAGVQLLANGDLLVGYRLASRHPVGDHDMIDDGAVVTTRSNGRRTHVVGAAPRSRAARLGLQRRQPHGTNARRRPRHVCDEGPACGQAGVACPPHTLFRRRSNVGPHGQRAFPLQDIHGTSRHGSRANHRRWRVDAAHLRRGRSGRGHLRRRRVLAGHGRTWTNKTVVARSSKVTFYEPAITRMSDGRFMAVIRTQNPPFDSYLTYSADEGRTWTEPRPLPFQGQTPFLFNWPPAP